MSKSPHQRSLPGFEDLSEDPQPESPQTPTPAAEEAKRRDQVVYVVDAFNLIFQVYHALPEMTSPTGEPVGAVHGFIRDIVDLWEKRGPDILVCAFDLPGPTFREHEYHAYKANRDEMPVDLRSQIPAIREMLAALSIPALGCEGFEADDVMATVARQAEAAGMQCYVVTADKDCRQLITERVKLFNIRKKQILDAAALEKDWGIRPDQVVDYQALVGDPTDNVPGVPLIGPKFARELLLQYDTLDEVLAHADEISGQRRRENLMQGREVAELSRRLVRLVNDVPIQFDWDAWRVGGVDHKRIGELCRRFGFRRLAGQLRRLAPSADMAYEAAEDYDDPGETTEWTTDYRLVATPEELDRLVEELAHQSRISVDTETTSTNPRWAQIVGYSFSCEPGVAYYIPVRSPADEPRLDEDLVRDKLKPILEDEAIRKVGQNLKYDMVVLRSAGIELRGLTFDTMVADYLLEPGERSHGIDDLAKRYLHYTKIKTKELLGTGKKQKRMDQVPVPLVTDYAAEDADAALRLSDCLAPRLEEEGLTKLFEALEVPLIGILADMEFHGIRVDKARLKSLGTRFGEKMAGLEGEIYEIAGKRFNIDSRQQLGKVLFDELGLPVQKKTKTGPSTDVAVLTELAKQHMLPAKIIEYRQFAKLKSTYVDSLINLIHPQTGRVHTSFRQDVAATGRLSSTDPNLQNIPVRTEEGRAIRSAFLPGYPDWKLLTADYSQIELRVLAHFSGDATLQQAFAEDQDIHRMVAAEVHGVPQEEVTSAMRRGAKAVNFGVIYGQSAFGLAKSLDIDKKQAAAFIDAYFARYPGVDEFMIKTLAECGQKGYVSTILGRRRAIQGVRDPSSLGESRQRNLPERIAVNTVIQGSAADLIKQAMINVFARLQRELPQVRMLLQIHDELVFEVPSGDIDRLADLVTEEMTSVERLSVSLKVDVKVGDNWAECEAWT